MGKLIIVSEFVDPAQNSTGYYWFKLISGLAERFDCGVCVVCPEDSFARLKVPIVGVEYECFKESSLDGRKLYSRVLKQLYQTFCVAKALSKVVKKGDVVFSGTNPSFMLLFLFLFKLLKPFNWVLLLHDIFPDNLVAAKILAKKSFVFKFLNLVFSRVYRSTDSMIAIGRDMQQLMLSKGVDTAEVVCVPNWVDLNDIQVLSRKEGLELVGGVSENRVVFQFFGNIGRVQGVENLLAAIAKVKNEKAEFVFIGGGAALSLVQDYIAKHPDGNVRYCRSLPFSQNNVGLAACDIALVSLVGGMNGLGVPSKAYFSMAANKPILVVSDRGSELHMMLDEYPQCGWFVEAGDPDSLANTIDKICSNFSIEVKRTANPRKIIESGYEYHISLDRYEDVLRKYFK